jgi:hypothetical protein
MLNLAGSGMMRENTSGSLDHDRLQRWTASAIQCRQNYSDNGPALVPTGDVRFPHGSANGLANFVLICVWEAPIFHIDEHHTNECPCAQLPTLRRSMCLCLRPVFGFVPGRWKTLRVPKAGRFVQENQSHQPERAVTDRATAEYPYGSGSFRGQPLTVPEYTILSPYGSSRSCGRSERAWLTSFNTTLKLVTALNARSVLA